MRAIVAAGLLAGFILGTGTVHAQETADRIWRNGPILTMNDAAIRTEAVAEKDGKIIAVGPEAHVMNFKGEETKVNDLAGRAMIPGFVDSHGHVVFGGLQALSANLLAPPDGEVRDIASLQETLRAWVEAIPKAVKKVNLIIGFGYDDAQLAQRRHPTRQELDEVSTDIPIIIVHQSGHLGVTNSKGLGVAGINKSSKNPPGGVIRRDDSGEPNEVLEEYAFFGAFIPMLSKLGHDGVLAFARAGSKLWASYGYTTAQDGRSAPDIVKALRELGAAGELPIDVVAFPDVLEARDFIAQNGSREYESRVRVGGCKLTIDGSPQGFTALRDRPYYSPVGQYPAGYKGYSAITMEQTQEAVDWCYEHNFQILTHANGEGASDMLIAAIGAAQRKYGADNRRSVLIHGQFLREDQVDSFQRLNVFPSLFPMHTFYWGDWHRDHTVGPVNAENISPTGWVRKRGMMFGTHHDAPVAFPDSMRVLAATVTRRTRSGDILGPAQRVDVITALKAMTIWPAWQHFEEEDKGSIEVGKLADFVILSNDPTSVDPETLADLKVLETVKEGKSIYRASVREGQLQYRVRPGRPDAFANFLRTLTAVHETGGRGRGFIPPSLLDRLPHSGACVAASLGKILTAGAAQAKAAAP